MEVIVWQPDGWAQTRIGVLTPERDVSPEAEFRALAGTAIPIHAARVRQKTYDPRRIVTGHDRRDRVRAFADPPIVDEAAELLRGGAAACDRYCFTSSSYLRGAADDVALKSRLEMRTRGIPVVISASAAVAALAALGAHRLALVHPPWFSGELDQEGAKYFASQGFDVMHSGPAGLPSDQQAIEPRELFDWVREHTPEKAEAVFIGGNGLRAIGVIKALEESLQPPSIDP